MHIDTLYYRHGYEYQVLKNDFRCQTNVLPEEDIYHEFIRLDKHGMLTIDIGYAWDGASKAFDVGLIRASLVHDAMYQLIRDGKISKKWRKQADKDFIAIAKIDGVPWFRRQYAYAALRLFGYLAVKRPRGVLSVPSES